MGFMQVPSGIARVVHDAEVLQAEKDVEVPLMIKLPAPVIGPLVGEKGQSVEDVYLEWYARRDNANGDVNGCKEAKA